MPSNNNDSSRNFDVAIVGGGIAGLSLAIGLINRKIPITIYESAHSFGEIGAGVFFHPNAIRAMNGIDSGITAGFEKVATFNTPALSEYYFDYRYGEGARAGELLFRPKCPGPHAGVHRADFLDELIKLVPKDVAHFGKRVDAIKNVGDKIQLKFRDGTEARHDCVIGADGVHSVVRKYILGADDPAAAPVFSGGYCHRGLIPMTDAIQFLGEEQAMNCQSYLGHGAHLLTFPVNGGKTFNAVAFSHCDTWDYEKWVVDGNVKDIYEDFKDFGLLGQEIIKRMESTDIWALFDHHIAARTFCNGNAAVIGDAAHATTPYQGLGAGFAIEDAYILSSLFGHVQRLDQIESCLKAYNAVRIGRGHKLVKTSREAGQLWNMSDPEAGDNVEKIKENAETRWHWAWHEDLEAEIQQGLQHMGLSG